jgi:hypothetical protein
MALFVCALPLVAAWMTPGTVDVGTLSCTIGRPIDVPGAPDTPVVSEAREMICTFKPIRNGPEEAYSAVVKSVPTMGRLPERLTILWSVKAPFGTEPRPGLLQQSFAADPAAATGREGLLAGEKNAELSLQPLADRKPGSASQEAALPPYRITTLELVLKVATG